MASFAKLLLYILSVAEKPYRSLTLPIVLGVIVALLAFFVFSSAQVQAAEEKYLTAQQAAAYVKRHALFGKLGIKLICSEEKHSCSLYMQTKLLEEIPDTFKFIPPYSEKFEYNSSVRNVINKEIRGQKLFLRWQGFDEAKPYPHKEIIPTNRFSYIFAYYKINNKNCETLSELFGDFYYVWGVYSNLTTINSYCFEYTNGIFTP